MCVTTDQTRKQIQHDCALPGVARRYRWVDHASLVQLAKNQFSSLPVSSKPTVLGRGLYPKTDFWAPNCASGTIRYPRSTLCLQPRVWVGVRRLLPDARAPVRVPTPLLAPEPYHLSKQPRKLIHEFLDLVFGHESVGDLFRLGEFGQLGRPGALHAPRADTDEHRADRGWG